MYWQYFVKIAYQQILVKVGDFHREVGHFKRKFQGKVDSANQPLLVSEN